MSTLELEGARIDFDVVGDAGPLVVQLHGLTSSRQRDAMLGMDLGRALRGHRILRYDARGHGSSTGSAVPSQYRWSRLADDLLRLLDHVAPGERVHGLGPSMGTGTLLHAAVADPDRFRSLTLVTPPTAWRSRPAKAADYQAKAELVERMGLGAFIHSGSTAPVPPALADAPETAPTVPESLLPSVLRGAAASDLPRPEVVATIEVPALILAWTGDPNHPRDTAEALHRFIKGSRLVIARSPYGIMAWPGLFAEHVTTLGAAG